jgi:uncharacterized protein
MPTWKCVKNCGACCHLDPSDRPDLDTYLPAAELEQYLSLVGPDGWCINFNHLDRTCKIYPDRPRFCRVTDDVFADMFEIGPEEVNDFAIECCHEQIEAVYGPLSLEMVRFDRETNELPSS